MPLFFFSFCLNIKATYTSKYDNVQSRIIIIKKTNQHYLRAWWKVTGEHRHIRILVEPESWRQTVKHSCRVFTLSAHRTSACFLFLNNWASWKNLFWHIWCSSITASTLWMTYASRHAWRIREKLTFLMTAFSSCFASIKFQLLTP